MEMLLKRKPGEGDGVRDEAGQPLGKSDRQAEAQCQMAQRPPGGQNFRQCFRIRSLRISSNFL